MSAVLPKANAMVSEKAAIELLPIIAPVSTELAFIAPLLPCSIARHIELAAVARKKFCQRARLRTWLRLHGRRYILSDTQSPVRRLVKKSEIGGVRQP
jgi:hypothetical protein